MLCIQLSGSAQYIRVTSLTKYEICLSKIKYSREFGEEKWVEDKLIGKDEESVLV